MPWKSRTQRNIQGSLWKRKFHLSSAGLRSLLKHDVFFFGKKRQKVARRFLAEHNKVNWSGNATEEIFSNPWG
jgi:hypothetical protein